MEVVFKYKVMLRTHQYTGYEMKISNSQQSEPMRVNWSWEQ